MACDSREEGERTALPSENSVMSRRYDSRTTTFSPEGRLYQVEYAMEAINNAAAAVGLLTKDGIVMAAEKRANSKLLDKVTTSEKMYLIDDHIACAVAGLTADANILISNARRSAQQNRYRFQEPIAVEQLIRYLCDTKQVYTQYGGLRPFGVSFLYAGWDIHHGFQLYHSDPSGNYGGWKATAIGNNNQTAKDKLKTEYKDGMTLAEALALAVKVLAKTMDITPEVERMEFSTLTRDEATGKIEFRVLPDSEASAIIEQVKEEEASKGDA